MRAKWFSYARIRAACIAALLVTLTTGIALAQEPSPPYDPQQVQIPERLPVAALGAELYAQNCAPCHGISGDGDGPAGAGATMDPTVFSDPDSVWERSPAEQFFVTKFGRIENLMPPWRNSLDDEQIWQAVYYAWNLQVTEAEIANGADLYAQSCAACHGEDGAGNGPSADEQMPDFSSQSSMIFVSNADLAQRWQVAHPDAGAGWSEEERRAALEYIRTFTYLPQWAPLSLTGPGSIAGRLLQGTADGPPPPQSEVQLNIYQQTELMSTRAASIDAEGNFRFEDLPVDAGFYYLVETEYLDIRYTSPILAFSGPDFTEGRVAPDRITTSLAVYEKTTDAAGLLVSRANWIIEHEPGSLLIGQVYSFANRSDRTFVGTSISGVDSPVTLAIPLPPNAEEVDLQDGEVGSAYRRKGDVIYDTRPVPPGETSRQVFARYHLPYSGNSAAITLPTTYDIELLNLLVADLPNLEAAVSLGGDSGASTGQDTIQGVLFRRWSAPLPAGAPVQVELGGLIAAGGRDPRPAGETQLNRSLPVARPPLDPRIPIGFGSVVGLILLAASLLLIRRARAGRAPTGEELAAQRMALIEKIARMDDLRSLDELDERAWQQRRAELKRELLAVAQAAQDMEPPQ